MPPSQLFPGFVQPVSGQLTPFGATDGLACGVHGGPWSTAALGHCPWGVYGWGVYVAHALSGTGFV